MAESSGDVNDQPTSGSLGIATLWPSAVTVLTVSDEPGASRYGREIAHGFWVDELDEIRESCASSASGVKKVLVVPSDGCPPLSAISFRVVIAVVSQAGTRPTTKVAIPERKALATAFSASASAAAPPPPAAQPDWPSLASRMYLGLESERDCR